MTVELEKVYRRLKTLKIQGATAVAQAIAENLILYIQKRQGRLNLKKQRIISFGSADGSDGSKMESIIF